MSDSSRSEADCPSNNWQAIKSFLDFTNSLTDAYDHLGVPYATLPGSIEVPGQNSLRRLHIYAQTSPFPGPGYDPECLISTTQQAAIADVLSATGALWSLGLANISTNGHGHPEDQLDAVHDITQDYYQPYTLVSCQHDVINGPKDQRPVGFPLPPGSSPSMLNVSAYNDSILPGYRTSASNDIVVPSHAFEYNGISRADILNTPGPPEENRLRWVELPADPFNGTAIGAIVLLPSEGNDTAQDIVVCNLGAGWGTTKLNTSTFTGAPQPVLSETGVRYPDPVTIKILDDTPHAEAIALGASGYFLLPTFPQHTVTVTEQWAAYLNPSIPSMNTTLFHHLMVSNITSIRTSTSVGAILAGLSANGLSNIGSTSKLQGTLKTDNAPDGSSIIDWGYWYAGKGTVFEVDGNESKDWVKLRVSSVFQGYAYNTHGVIPKLAICLLLLYCAFAIAHVLYAGISGISSTSWDSIAEVTALAVNSPPTTALRNTCAGITEFGIFKLPVRILTMRDEEGEGEHLEMVFGSMDEKSVEHKTIKPNRVYGTMPSMKPREKTL